jgi:predicted O-methyltransferase YrrM
MPGALTSPTVAAVLGRLHEQARAEDAAVRERVVRWMQDAGRAPTPAERYGQIYGDAPLAIVPEVGRLYHALLLTAARGRAINVVEFGASHGISTIYVAAALRDAGAGRLITTELRATKAALLRVNLEQAGLDDLVEIRVGDALETLAVLPASVTALVLDGRNDQYEAVYRLLEPRLAADALVIADLSADDADIERYQQFIRDPARGYASVELPLDAGVEVSLRLGHL